MDENADDFEYQCIDFIQQLLTLMGITVSDKTVPVFKRNRIANQLEQTQMIMAAAEYLDDETLLDKLPWVTVDEVTSILDRRAAANAGRFKLKLKRKQRDDGAPAKDAGAQTVGPDAGGNAGGVA